MKYPRTPHLSFSPGGTNDDKRLSNESHFLNKKVIITEKLDGSNVSLDCNNVFARSHAGPPTHESFDLLKSFHAANKYNIQEGLQLFGEWVYAKHSIHYTSLPEYLFLFGGRIDDESWISWEEVELWAYELGCMTAPVLFCGEFKSSKELKEIVENLCSKQGLYSNEREGVVIRLYDHFSNQDFSKSIAKWVRKDHVQTDKHWKSSEIIRNIKA